MRARQKARDINYSAHSLETTPLRASYKEYERLFRHQQPPLQNCSPSSLRRLENVCRSFYEWKGPIYEKLRASEFKEKAWDHTTSAFKAIEAGLEMSGHERNLYGARPNFEYAYTFPHMLALTSFSNLEDKHQLIVKVPNLVAPALDLFQTFFHVSTATDSALFAPRRGLDRRDQTKRVLNPHTGPGTMVRAGTAFRMLILEGYPTDTRLDAVASNHSILPNPQAHHDLLDLAFPATTMPIQPLQPLVGIILVPAVRGDSAEGFSRTGHPCAILLERAGLFVDGDVTQRTRYQAVRDGEPDNAGPDDGDFWGYGMGAVSLAEILGENHRKNPQQPGMRVSNLQGIQDTLCHMHMERVKGFGPVTKGRVVAWKILCALISMCALKSMFALILCLYALISCFSLKSVYALISARL
ncbi:hypothetical protein FJTKL_05598 [Diaporthe vaccinii]|uniref:Uncharacterized protein n=1 Tax=Diaporthe vaccinii TaxID=105482 RepID=A0ABR4DRW5_9PEZI